MTCSLRLLLEAWRGKPIATADKILTYLDEVFWMKQDIRRHIRFNQHVQTAKWSSADQRWHLDVLDKTTGETKRYAGISSGCARACSI